MPADLPTDALVLLIGPAASGKSTYAARSFRPSAVLSSDALRAAVSDDPADQSASADAFRALHLLAQARLRRGLLTVVDATNLETSSRAPLLALARRFGRPAVALVFDTPLEVCLERNERRIDRRVPEAVVRRHFARSARTLAALQGEGYALIHRVNGVEVVGPDG